MRICTPTGSASNIHFKKAVLQLKHLEKVAGCQNIFPLVYMSGEAETTATPKTRFHCNQNVLVLAETMPETTETSFGLKLK